MWTRKLQMLIGSSIGNPGKLLHGQCNGVVMMQGRDGSGSQRRKAFCKVAPIPSTLLFAPLTQTLLSPSFCNLSQQFWQVALLKCTNSSSWQKVPDLVSPQFASWAVSSGSSWVTIPVSEKPRSCLLRLGRGTHCTGVGGQ